MVRVFALAFLFAILGLGTVAYADCTTCFTSVFAQRSPANGIELRFLARTDDSAPLPATVTGVVMQVDGNRTKCGNLTLAKQSESHGTALYTGSFGAYGNYSHAGRIELGGQIYEFTVPLDGSPGTVSLAADQTPLNRNGVRLQVTAAPATPAPTIAPRSAEGFTLPTISPALVLGAGVVFVTIVGAYVDRRRALARSVTA